MYPGFRTVEAENMVDTETFRRIQKEFSKEQLKTKKNHHLQIALNESERKKKYIRNFFNLTLDDHSEPMKFNYVKILIFIC